MHTRLAIAVAAALAGCAQPKPAVDTTPEHPTAVFETVMSSTGIAGMFPFETTEKRYVRSDMRREDQATKGTGRFTGFLVTRVMRGGDGANIARLDRKVYWTLNHGRKEYFECPISGCPVPAGAQEMPQQGGEAGRREEPRQQTEEGCVAKVASSNLDVKATGQKRSLNGFDTEQYQVAWVVRLQDKEKRTTTSTVKFDIWTTPVNAQIRQAMETEAAFGRALMANMPRTEAPALKPAQAGVMPPEMLSMMTGYLTSVSPADRAAFTRSLRELEKIKGHPISSKTEWFLEGNACGAKDDQQQAQQQQPQPQSASAMLGQMAGRLLKKEEPATTGPKPLLSFTVEVKQLGVQPVRDSTFSVPPSYKLIKLP